MTGRGKRIPQRGGYLNSGVDEETYKYYADEHGGIPVFDWRGMYIGFQSLGFDSTEQDEAW